MDERATVVRLIQAIHPDNISIGIDPGRPVRLVERTAFRAKIIHIKIVAFPTFIAPHPPHETASSLSLCPS